MTRCLLWTISTCCTEKRHLYLHSYILKRIQTCSYICKPTIYIYIIIYIHIEFIIVWYAWFVNDCIHAPCAKREVIWYGIINDFQGRNKSDGRANSTTIITMRLDYVMVLIFRLWHYLSIYMVPSSVLLHPPPMGWGGEGVARLWGSIHTYEAESPIPYIRSIITTPTIHTIPNIHAIHTIPTLHRKHSIPIIVTMHTIPILPIMHTTHTIHMKHNHHAYHTYNSKHTCHTYHTYLT